MGSDFGREMRRELDLAWRMFLAAWSRQVYDMTEENEMTLVKRAIDPCDVCGQPIERTELAWERLCGPEVVWEQHATLLCSEGHGRRVDRLEP